jgi:hypothetical protein
LQQKGGLYFLGLTLHPPKAGVQHGTSVCGGGPGALMLAPVGEGSDGGEVPGVVAPGADDMEPAGVGQQLGEDVPGVPRVTPGKRRVPRPVPEAMFLPSNWRLHEAQQPRQDMPEQQIEREQEEQQDDAALTSLLPSVLPTPALPSAAEY